MAPSLSDDAMATVGEGFASDCQADPAMEIDGNSLAMQCLRDAVQASGLPQKQLTGGLSVPQFNKLLNGVQAFGVARLDRLPSTVRDDFMKRYGDACGLEVRAKDPVVIAEEAFALIERLAHLSRLMRLGRPRQAKAALSRGNGKLQVG